MKNNRFGQSAIITTDDYIKLRRFQRNQKHKLILDIAWFTGERWGAIIQLLKNDCYHTNGAIKDVITFRSNTRKASPDGKRQTRQVPVHATLKEHLSAYSTSVISEWMFPRNNHPSEHVGLRTADYFFRDAIERAGLGNRGISTHSTRRTMITRLYNNGVDLMTIKQITGHRDVKSLMRYIEHDEQRTIGAIQAL
ncbi:MAG: site-specific integrase [Cyanobacteria bacterium P01_A01_bin.68]